MFSNEDKEKVRAATDLAALVGETVALRPRGADLWGCCPFHHEKSPSFHVIPSRGLWKCFGCGKGGDCFAFVMERDHVDFPDAVRYLADRASIQLSDDGERRGRSTKKSRLLEAMDAACELYHHQLTHVRSEGADRARAYLAGRGFGSAVADRWDLGYAPGKGFLARELSARGFTRQELVDARLVTQRDDGSVRDAFYDRVIFPIRDERGQVVAFGGRIMGPKTEHAPKYINSRESSIYNKSRTMFALDRAKAHITAQMEVVIEEGYTDVISSHEAGIQNATAACGTSLTAQHVRMLDRFLRASGDAVSRGRIVCLFDGDAAGIHAAERALSFTSLTTASLYCVILPDDKDPAEFLASDGPDAMRALLASPEPLARFVIDRHLERFDLETPEGRAPALADVVQAMAPLKGTPLADDYAEYVAGRLLIDVRTVKSALARVRKPEVRDDDPVETPLVRRTSTAPVTNRPAFAGARTAARPMQPDDDAVPYDDTDVPADVVAEAEDAGVFLDDTAAVVSTANLLPEDAAMVRVEREVLSTIAASPDAAQPFAERLAGVRWADPRHEAIAWALLSLPAGSTPMQALDAAEGVVPEAASILADGTMALADESDDARALSILIDDLEMRSLRRRIDRGRAQLRTPGAFDTPEAYDQMFADIAEMQRRLRELEGHQRATK